MPDILTLDATIDQASLDRVAKRLDKWKGAPLAIRTQKAEQAALKLLVNPLRSASPHPGHEIPPEDSIGTLMASITVWKLRQKNFTELGAYAVGPRGGRSTKLKVAPHRNVVIRGHKMKTHSGRTVGFVQGNPFVGRVGDPMTPRLIGFIHEQITRLA
jgi:hypothetical protein